MTLHPMQRVLRSLDPVLRSGRVRKIMPTHIEADGPDVSLGTLCSVEARAGAQSITLLAEVVRVDRESISLVPLEEVATTFSGAEVVAVSIRDSVPVGDGFLGRAVDAFGRPLDGKQAPTSSDYQSLRGTPLGPMERTSPKEILETGIRAIDGLLTLGKGQRVGIFAASGVGKTSLVNQIARQTKIDVTVLCLVGERGREVEAAWNQGLDDATRARTTLVAATSDQSAPMRVRAVLYSIALAEHWRARGKHVLLLLDSVTRFAMALREMGLAAGEPPTIRAYTPSVFSAIPKVVERCGAAKAGGAITAIMTVLSENDDVDDPVSELMKSLLDGHIVLSRVLADQGHFPAIDISRSISRQAEGLLDEQRQRAVLQAQEWISTHETSRTLIDTGLYVSGSNSTIDQAIERHPLISRFRKQSREDHSDLRTTHMSLISLVSGGT